MLKTTKKQQSNTSNTDNDSDSYSNIHIFFLSFTVKCLVTKHPNK